MTTRQAFYGTVAVDRSARTLVDVRYHGVGAKLFHHRDVGDLHSLREAST
jgi:hypothetical protein